MRRVLLGALALVVLAAGAVVVARRVVSGLDNALPAILGESCLVRTTQGERRLEPEQAAHAATIAAVARRRRLPDRAVTIALATALQESKLRNLAAGDRDSVGLFQQRPSQGWGSAVKLQDPRYAAGRFYDRLVTVPGWQRMRLTDAAQAVQKSAHPELYQQWEPVSAVLATAFTGAAATAVVCEHGETAVEPQQPGPTGLTPRTAALRSGLDADFGRRQVSARPPGAAAAEGRSLAVTTGAGRQGWSTAHWLVAHASGYAVDRVAHAGKVWTRESGAWTDDAAAPSGQVVAEVARGTAGR